MTEGWATRNLYCIACKADSLAPHETNRAVEDYHCLACHRRVQLKAKNGPLGATISNSAYEKKRAAIAKGRAPDYCFMSYDRENLCVDDLLWVPGHFITLSVVSKRKPLPPSARRAGWVGSNIHLDLVPNAGKIPLVTEGRIAAKKEVRAQFRSLVFLNQLVAEQRGWLTDILTCLDNLELRSGSKFTNGDVYECEGRLSCLHPRNRNIRPKIRQQLQVLAANGIVKRVSPGVYERI